jgi:hypothetical protein
MLPSQNGSVTQLPSCQEDVYHSPIKRLFPAIKSINYKTGLDDGFNTEHHKTRKVSVLTAESMKMRGF